MNPSVLIEWLQDPDLLNKESLVQLRSLLDAYPCFVTARTLYLKNLYMENDHRYSNELIRTSIFVPDRRRLFYFMEDRKDKAANLPSVSDDSPEPEGFSIIDRFLNNPATNDMTIEPEKEPEKVSNTEEKSISAYVSMENDEVFYSDTLSYPGGSSFTLDYLSYLSMNSQKGSPAVGGDTSTNAEDVIPVAPMPGQEYIDAFLANPETKISFGKSNTGDIAEDAAAVSKTDEEEAEAAFDKMPEDTFTLTLAKIYLKQKRYDRALEIIKSLSLKYPEKNVYFADQIRFLEKLIINTKKQ